MKIFQILRKRRNSGFTLVEVIISCVLLGILILGMFSIVTPIISGVKNREQSANALMLAEAADMYINRSIQNAIYVAIFENAKPADMQQGAEGAKTIARSKQMEEMLEFINGSDNKDADGNEIYELKCIGIRWAYDAKSQRHKYMITNERVNKTTGAVDYSTNVPDTTNPGSPKSYLVFETIFYDDLFPKFGFDILETNVLDEDGNPVMEDDGVTPKMAEVPAIKTTLNVYRDAEMDELAPQTNNYVECINISRQQMSTEYKLFSKKGVKAGDGTYIADSATVFTHAESEFNDNEQPETYIYYITRKLKTANPTTPPASSTV